MKISKKIFSRSITLKVTEALSIAILAVVIVGIPATIALNGKLTLLLMVVLYFLTLSATLFGNIHIWNTMKEEYVRVATLLEARKSDIELLPFKKINFRSYILAVLSSCGFTTIGLFVLWSFRSPLTFVVMLIPFYGLMATIVSCIFQWKLFKKLGEIEKSL